MSNISELSVQEILLLDSTTTVCVGANQLKKLLNTLRDKEDTINRLSKANENLLKEKSIIFNTLSAQDKEITALNDTISELTNVRVKCKYIHIKDI